MTDGPDQILPSDSFITTDIYSPVSLRVLKDVSKSSSSTPQQKMEGREPISVPSLLVKAFEKNPNQAALSVKRGEQWITWNYKEFLDEVRIAAKGFISLGLEPRMGVGIIGFNSPEWFISDLAAVFANGVATGIYPTNSPEACKFIAKDCRASIVVLEDEKQLDKFLAIRSELPDLKMIVQYSGQPKMKEEDGVISWKRLLEIGKTCKDDELDSRIKSLSINQCCHLVYTSGTTGNPKGAMLSHDNLTFTAKVLCDTFEMRDLQERIVSYLPLSHIAANITDMFVMITCAGTIYFADRDALKGTLTNTLRHALPTLFLGVPRVWEKMHEKMSAAGKANKGLKRQIGQWAKKTGFKHNQRRLANPTAGGGGGGLGGADGASSIKYKIADKIVFQKVKAALGFTKCLRFYSGAAPCSRDIIEYFMSLDIRILEIYGMSECSGPQLSNTYIHQKLGTIGKTLVGLNSLIKPLDDDNKSINEIVTGGANESDSDIKGEICMIGRNIMMGYLNNPEKTKEAFTEDEYLRSGDVGRQDAEGFVTITGRIKEILITAGGENVAPVLIEDAVKRHLPCISNVMVIGDKRKFVSCLLTLKVDMDQESLEPTPNLAENSLSWCEEIGSKAKTVEEALMDTQVKEAIQKGIDLANEEAISNAQKLRKWIILPRDLSIPGGELGPTLKMKRHVVAKKYAKEIDGIYA